MPVSSFSWLEQQQPNKQLEQQVSLVQLLTCWLILSLEQQLGVVELPVNQLHQLVEFFSFQDFLEKLSGNTPRDALASKTLVI